MDSRKFSIAALAVLVIVFGTGIIYFLKRGAFKDPEIKVTEAPAYVVAGTLFKGRVTGKEFGRLFDEADKLVAEKKIAGRTCGIFYNMPESASEEQEAFVGVLMDDTTQTLPEGYSKRYLPARKVLEGRVDNFIGSPLIYPKLEEYAEEHNIKISTIPAIEIYLPTKEMYVQVPVK